MEQMSEVSKIADRVIDLGADFRLKNAADYPTWYGYAHKCPGLLKHFVYGMPELHCEEIKKARWVAVPGCTSTSAIIPLWPLVKKYRLMLVVIDSKVGSSAGGSEPGLDSHHPERAGVVRSFKPSGHRHLAEMEQELGLAKRISFSPHAVELVRGILSTIHVFIEEDFTEKDIWQIYLQAYGEEPFVRIVKERTGIYRYPEPKLVAGTNYCDIGFEKDERTGRLVIMSALDNLMKGAAGQAVQCFNLMYGVDESAGLDGVGLHP
jgi:N-acetyl-gamma-glutamyl-phosphate/LysW-gamma-L-alpha-aminoadipyl-6-phosphate reductase